MLFCLCVKISWIITCYKMLIAECFQEGEREMKLILEIVEGLK